MGDKVIVNIKTFWDGHRPHRPRVGEHALSLNGEAAGPMAVYDVDPFPVLARGWCAMTGMRRTRSRDAHPNRVSLNWSQGCRPPRAGRFVCSVPTKAKPHFSRTRRDAGLVTRLLAETVRASVRLKIVSIRARAASVARPRPACAGAMI